MREINQSLKDKVIGEFDWLRSEEKLRMAIINSVVGAELSLYVAKKLGILRRKYANEVNISVMSEVLYLISKRAF